MKAILIGNGFNIQFGGMAYSSEFIMKRIKYRARMRAYEELFWHNLSPSDILYIFNGFVDISNDIVDGEYDAYVNDTDTQEALADYRKRYGKITSPHEIMLEDWFFILHIFYLKNKDLSADILASKQGFEMLILDAIFNSGKIQNIYLSMGKKVKRYLLSFDDIFTLNYDNNIETLAKKRVYHLHGDFSVYQCDVAGMEHCFCNALLNYSGKQKFKDAANKPEYGFNEFRGIRDEIHIVGMSPNNDSHILNCIMENSKLSKIYFYWYSKKEKDYIEAHFPRERVEAKSVAELWDALDSKRKIYHCDYQIPKGDEVDKFMDAFNALSDDDVPHKKMIEAINAIPQFEIDRLCKLVKSDMMTRNPEHKPTDEQGFIEANASISYIALQEGVLPSALFMICVMNFKKIKD